MTELELVERVKSEEDTLCSLPFDSQYKMRRAKLTKLVNLHRAMLVDIVSTEDGCAGQGGAEGDCQTAAPARMSNCNTDCPAPQGCATGGEPDEVRVLVVESEPIVALLLRLVLENRGYSVREVATRAEAAAVSGRWAPDVIVTEFPFTDATGFGFVVQVSADMGARGALVVGTGPKMSQAPGVDALFARPFEAEEVARKVGSLIGDGMDGPCLPMCVSTGCAGPTLSGAVRYLAFSASPE